MPIPNLIHPVDAIINILDTTNTKYNKKRREHINVVNRNVQKIIECQVRFITREHPDAKKLGIDLDTQGYIIVRHVDMESLSIVLKRGDNIKKLGNIDCNYFLTANRPGSHDSVTKRFELYRYQFSDRKP